VDNVANVGAGEDVSHRFSLSLLVWEQ
jgi:hypothetical protein